jgi:hypothetical protein
VDPLLARATDVTVPDFKPLTGSPSDGFFDSAAPSWARSE